MSKKYEILHFESRSQALSCAQGPGGRNPCFVDGAHLLLALLAATTQAQHQMESGLLLDVVVGQGAAVLKLLASENQALLIRGDSWRRANRAGSEKSCHFGSLARLKTEGKIVRNGMKVSCALTLLVLNLGLDIVDGVRRLHLKGDSLARDCGTTRPVGVSARVASGSPIT